MIKNNLAIGIDVGGSHVSCAAFNLNEKKYLPETFAESDLDNHGPADEIIAVWSKTIARSIEAVGLENLSGIGFAMPGPFNYEKGIPLFTGENNKYENIYGINVPAALRKSLNLPVDFPIRFINDATAFAIGEDWAGKAQGSKRSLSITLGTGFGSAFLKDNLPVTSGDDVPEQGCIWHLPFKDGIADDYFSTRGLVGRYQQKTGKSVKGVKEIAMSAPTEEVARELFNDFGSQLVNLLQPWLERFQVEVLVIGGNIANAYDWFQPALTAALKDNNCAVRVEISSLKETAAIIGSAVLADHSFYARVEPLLAEM